MALNNLGLGFVFTARNLASGTINRLRGQLGGLGQHGRLAGLAIKGAMVIATGAIINLMVGVGLLAGAFALANMAGNFEQQMSLVGALAGATGARLETLRNAAIEAGLATRFSPDEAVEGLKNLITAGLDAEQAALALTPALQVATFGMISVGDAGNAVVGSLNAFRRQGLSAQQVADRLALAMARTNFQATDFDGGLSAVAGTAGLFNQTLDTTLVAMGLLRNMNIGASRSATALREAIRRLGSDQRAMAEATTLLGSGGIFSDNGRGRMRDILDIMGDMDVATRDMTDSQRQQRIASILGARGLQLFAAVQGAEYRKRLADGTTLIYRGIDAARELRREMGESAGFADMLQRAVSEGNFTGILTVITGVIQTMGVELGRPFAEVLIPVLVIVRESLTALVRLINRIPGPIKRFFAGSVLLTGVMLTLSGIVGLVVAAIILLIPVIKAVAIGFAIVTAGMIPFIAGFAALIGVIVLFRHAIQLNIGGVTQIFSKAFGRIRLAFNGIYQLFSEGALSGAVRNELRLAENSGIRDFVINVFRIYARLREFFNGIRIGFSRALEGMTPRFTALWSAVLRLFEALGFTSTIAGDLADSDINSWAETGARVGGILADVLGIITDGLKNVFIFGRMVIDFFKVLWVDIEPFFNVFMEDVGRLGRETQAMFRELGVASGTNLGGMSNDARSLASVFEVVLIAILAVAEGIIFISREIVGFITILTRLKNYITDAYSILSIQVSTTFAAMNDSIMNSLDSVLVYIGDIINRIPTRFRPEGLNGLVNTGNEARDRIGVRTNNMNTRNEAARAQVATITNQGNLATQERQNIAATQQRDIQIATALRDLATERQRDRAEMKRPIQVMIDGQVVANAVSDTNRRENALGFVPATAD